MRCHRPREHTLRFCISIDLWKLSPTSKWRVLCDCQIQCNPTSFTEITWSIVATISSSAFSMLDKVITCVVSDQGVVTVFDYYYMVIRYDPSATPNGGTASTGPGGWMNITVSNTLGRDGWRTWLAFYVKDAAAGGAQTLLTLTLTPLSLMTRTLQFGVVDETTKTPSHAANWTITVVS